MFLREFLLIGIAPIGVLLFYTVKKINCSWIFVLILYGSKHPKKILDDAEMSCVSGLSLRMTYFAIKRKRAFGGCLGTKRR